MNPLSQARSTGIQLENLSPPQPRAQPPPNNPQSAPHTYYSNFPSLSECFLDLDIDSNYDRCKQAILNDATKNFIVDFGGAPEERGAAWCALNIDQSTETVEAVKKLLGKSRPRALRTRWINIFSPREQKPLVKAIATYYGLSSRHTSALTAGPPLEALESEQRKSVDRSRLDRMMEGLHRHRDLEDGGYSGSLRSEETSNTMKEVESMRRGVMSNGGFMDLVSNVWHWHAVEWGGRFMCIGFNSLHQVPPGPEEQQKHEDESDYEDEWLGDEDGEKSMDKGENYPQGKRLWSWLVLCDDGTILMFHEPVGKVSPQQMEIIRKNMMTVFRSLSRAPLAVDDMMKSAGLGAGLEEMPFRRSIAEDKRSENVESGPSLLFYYLFDDWYSSLQLVIGRGAPYSTHMTNLRKEMQRNPKLSHISRLHRLARQLATLKRMYETKGVIIDNVLYRQENSLSKPSTDSKLFTNPKPSTNSPTPSSSPDLSFEPLGTMGDSDILGVPLSPLAVAKFERLRDRVKLYALGEIDDCLAEKSELVDMTFNLIAMREAQAVERLTRVAIFLTKFTFLFLPLTLITGYFSMQLNDLNGKYTVADFWGASGIFVALMILVLYTVGRSTQTQETGIMWESIKQVWFGCCSGRKGKKGIGKRKNRK